MKQANLIARISTSRQRCRAIAIGGAAAAGLLVLAPAVRAAAFPLAASPGLGLKPGLWQFEITFQSIDGRQVLDGRDLLARVLASVDPTDLALDRMNLDLAHSPCESGVFAKISIPPPDANSNGSETPCTLPGSIRARSESAARENGANLGATATFPLCVTPELARLQIPILDVGNRCHPTAVSQNGKHLRFHISCSAGSTMMSGQGEAHRSLFGRILTQIDLDVHTATGKHFVVHDNTEMKFISADCGHVRPPGP